MGAREVGGGKRWEGVRLVRLEGHGAGVCDACRGCVRVQGTSVGVCAGGAET